MTNRFTEGFKLYKNGKVQILPQKNKEFIEFEVEGTNQVYRTEFDLKEGTLRCSFPGCPDYENRAKYAAGSFLCKHTIASFFKLAEIKGVNRITNLEG